VPLKNKPSLPAAFASTGASKLLQPVENQPVDFSEQEKTEATELFFLRCLFSPFAPVQNFCADNHNKGN
jgi:hypothetical protein